jgi:ABC-2 type transport system ATP-binding protein
MLEAVDVHKSYGSRLALAGIDLTIARGEVCCLLGPNGAGKTTFASIVAGLRRADRGSVVVDGIDVARRPYSARDRLGYAPQELAIYPLASARDNLRIFGALAGLRGRALRQRIEELAGRLGLEELLGRQAGLLSGGEQRRLHAAMALLHRPRVLLLDEPTVGADVEARARLLDFVRGLAGEGTAVCYSTHYLAEVEVLDAMVALIDGGRIIARGGVRQLVAEHATSMVELRFAGPAPTLPLSGLDAAADGDRLRITSRDPAADAAAALRVAAALGHPVTSVDFVRPSLDAVFLALTGTRLGADGNAGTTPAAQPGGEERADVVAS